MPQLRLVKATVQAQAAASSAPRKLLLWAALGAVAVGLLILVVAQGREATDRDPDQAWFWTPEWQAGEAEADEDIAAERGTFYASDEAFLASLEERVAHGSTSEPLKGFIRDPRWSDRPNRE